MVVVEGAGPHAPEGRERWALRGRVGQGGGGHVARVEERGCEERPAEGGEGVRAEPFYCVGVDRVAGDFGCCGGRLVVGAEGVGAYGLESEEREAEYAKYCFERSHIVIMSNNERRVKLVLRCFQPSDSNIREKDKGLIETVCLSRSCGVFIMVDVKRALYYYRCTAIQLGDVRR